MRRHDERQAARAWASITALALIAWTAACTRADGPATGMPPPSAPVTTPSGLVYRVMQPGTGPAASAGQIVLIHETTSLQDGTVLMDTWALNHPLQFQLGGGQVIDGIDEGVTGMRVGERRRLIVPPALGKRESLPEEAPFGPDDTLYYDVVLLQVLEAEPPR